MTVESRFWANVDKRGTDECWLWKGYASVEGYGRMRVGGGERSMVTHVSLNLAGRPGLDGDYACHTCDTPACVNPRHLYWGDAGTNARDRFTHGRGLRGEDNLLAVLSAEQVVELRERASLGERYGDIAGVFGIHEETVSRIARGVERRFDGGPIVTERRPRVGEHKVAEMRRMRAAGSTLKEIVEALDVGMGTAHRATLGLERV